MTVSVAGVPRLAKELLPTIRNSNEDGYDGLKACCAGTLEYRRAKDQYKR